MPIKKYYQRNREHYLEYNKNYLKEHPVDKETMKEKSYQIILVVSIFINIIFIMILLLNLIGNIYFKDTDWCDYDSCSQEIYKWNYNGSSCFDSNNSECQDFLRLWNACQEYKNRLGVC